MRCWRSPLSNRWKFGLKLLKKIFKRNHTPLPAEIQQRSSTEEDKIINHFKEQFAICFNDPSLLITAFKHRSYLNITNEQREASNETIGIFGGMRTGFGGYSILIRKDFPKRNEGQLSKIKSILVSQPVLAEIATQLSLGDLILINKGEEKTGGRKRHSNLSDTFEAIIGALYLDQGLDKARDFIQKYLLSKFKTNHAKRIIYELQKPPAGTCSIKI